MDTELLEKLKKTDGKKYIYGAGNLAQYLYRELLNKGVKIEGFIVDGCSSSGTIPIYDMREVVKSNAVIGTLIIGFASGYAKVPELRECACFDDVIEFALPFDHHAHFSEEWVEENQVSLVSVKDCFEDELSKDMFDAFINAVSQESVSYVREVFDFERTYFDNDVIQLGNDETFLEIGAFEGNSIIEFNKKCGGSYRRIIGIEPDSENYSKLVKNIEDSGIEAELHNIGCWNEHAFLSFDSDGKISRLKEGGDETIEVESVDKIVGNNEITLINLGVSVAQKEILSGAEETIRKNKPKMIVFLGSANEELFTIPLLLKSIRPDYKLYIRFAQCMPSRFFLFAV